MTGEGQVSPADRTAAHELLSELRTRIATQPLPYQHGVETRALESLREIFDHARGAMKQNPGCALFARRATEILNTVLRPITAKWDRARVEGRLASKDGADELRGDLEAARLRLRAFSEELQSIAYGVSKEDVEAPPALSDAELADCLRPLQFGIATNRTDVAAEAPVPTSGGVRAQGQARGYLETIALINASEASDIHIRRSALPHPGRPGHDAVGLALSGGGIRSATFCLGVVQVLAQRGLLEHVDFLSTVSGGGYTGSFLTTTLPEGAAADVVGGPHGPDPMPVAQLRANAKYLTSANLWETWSKVTATVAGMLLNWTAPLFVVFLAALVAASVHPERSLVRFWRPAFIAVGAAIAVSFVIYGALTRRGPKATLAGGWTLAAISAIGAIIVVAWALTAGHQALPRWLAMHWPISGAIAALIGAGPAIIRFAPVLRSPFARTVTLKVLLVMAAVAIPVLGLAAFYWAWDLGTAQVVTLPALGTRLGISVLLGATVIVGAVALFVIDVNLTGPHRLYRDSLARTFVGTSDPNLETMNGESRAPYHLINATVNLPSSRRMSIRDRKGDFFLFSKHWCGSVATGYAKTQDWKVGRRAIDLKTAISISGAAASSHMGLMSMPALTALITFLNVRLGFWMPNPAYAARWPPWPGFSCLLREMLGIGMSESSPWLNLSDGGHIENSGCYELLRRRCKFIVAVDGEADPHFTFGGLLTVVRHAQIDLGIRIDPQLDELRSDPRTGYSLRHALLCRIRYPASVDGKPEGTGLLLYLKASVTGNESELVKRYRAKHPEFPHQSTLDQFFDQEQFEAYRQLGVHVTEGLFSRAVLESRSPSVAEPARADVDTVRGWFERLARNLLDPTWS
jgi:hypothetical protein